MDSRLKSVSEGITNVIPGFLVAYFATFVILPPFSAEIEASDPIVMGIIATFFTGISLARMYILRRVFTKLGENENLYTLIKKLIGRKNVLDKSKCYLCYKSLCDGIFEDGTHVDCENERIEREDNGFCVVCGNDRLLSDTILKDCPHKQGEKFTGYFGSK